MSNEFWYDKIDAYLLNKLTSEEMSALKKAANEDEKLAQEIAIRKLEFEVSEELIANDIRLIIKSARNQTKTNKTDFNKFFTNWFGLVISLLVILVLAVIFVIFKNNSGRPHNNSVNQENQISKKESNTRPSQKIFTSDTGIVKPILKTKTNQNKKQKIKLLALANNLYSPPNFEYTRNTDIANDPLDDAIEHWNKKEWIKAIEKAKNIPATSPQFIKAKWLQAHAQFLLHNYSVSADLFEQIKGSKIQPYSEASDWYSLLIMVAESKHETTIFNINLNKLLSDPDHPFYENALNLKKGLDK